jgi:hypothetical protein
VRTANRAVVQQAVQAIAAPKKKRFLLGPALDGWVSVYPESCDETAIQAIAANIPGEIIYVMSHDNDIFAYSYFKDGKLVDSFNSRPDYFQPVSPSERKKLRGRPPLLQGLLAPGKALDELQTLLSPETIEQTPFALELLDRFADLLGLPNAVSSYEYLMEGERENIRRWKDFIHVPDRSDEKARTRTAAAKIRAERARLRREKILVYEKQGNKNKTVSVACCPDRNGDGFLTSWYSHFESREAELQKLDRLAPPWSPTPSPISVIAGPFVHDLCLSPSGKLLAIGRAGGNWKCALWDLEREQMISEVDNAPRYLFSPDEKYLLGCVQSSVIVHETATGNRVAKHTACPAVGAAVHESGLLVIGDTAGKLSVIDPLSGQKVKVLCVGQKVDSGAMHRISSGIGSSLMGSTSYWDQLRSQLEKQFAATGPGQHLSRSMDKDPGACQRLAEQGFVFNSDGILDAGRTADAHLEKMRRGMEEQQQRMAEAFNRPGVESSAITGSEHPVSLLCSPDGRWLFCGTNRGLRGYDWAEILAAEEITPRPKCQVDLQGIIVERATRSTLMDARIQALAFDRLTNTLLFAGIDGLLRRLDLATGQDQVLIALPGKPGVWQMIFCANCHYLCCVVRPLPNVETSDWGAATLLVWDCHRLLAGANRCNPYRF